MQVQGRRVLLLMDNASVHGWFVKDKIKAINVLLFSASITSATHPIDKASFSPLHTHTTSRMTWIQPIKDVTIVPSTV